MINDAKFHHIGYAVNSIDEVKKFYIGIGYSISEIVIEPIQKVYVAYATSPTKPTIELLQPLNEKSPICNILSKNGCCPYHICYEVDNIQSAIAELRTIGFMPLGKPIPGKGLDDALMVFTYNKNVGLVQIMETKIK